MAAVPDNLGRVAWERGIESRDLMFSYDNTRNMSQLLCSRLMMLVNEKKVYEEDSIKISFFII